MDLDLELKFDPVEIRFHETWFHLGSFGDSGSSSYY